MVRARDVDLRHAAAPDPRRRARRGTDLDLRGANRCGLARSPATIHEPNP
jgi:hypothetical protein